MWIGLKRRYHLACAWDALSAQRVPEPSDFYVTARESSLGDPDGFAPPMSYRLLKYRARTKHASFSEPIRDPT